MTETLLPSGVIAISAAQLPAALVGGRLSVDASGAAVPVTDNAGSLTVDAPVGTPVAVRLSDGSSFIATLATDPSDRSARLLGHVTVDSAPPVTGAITVSNQSVTSTNTVNNLLVQDDQTRRLLERLLIETQELKAIMAHQTQQDAGRLDLESSTEVLTNASRR